MQKCTYAVVRVKCKPNTIYSMIQRFLPLPFLPIPDSTEVSELAREWLVASLLYRYRWGVVDVIVGGC